MPPELGDWGSSPARTELLERDPFLFNIVGGGRSTPAVPRSEPGLSPNPSEDDWSSPLLLLPR